MNKIVIEFLFEIKKKKKRTKKNFRLLNQN